MGSENPEDFDPALILAEDDQQEIGGLINSDGEEVDFSDLSEQTKAWLCAEDGCHSSVNYTEEWINIIIRATVYYKPVLTHNRPSSGSTAFGCACGLRFVFSHLSVQEEEQSLASFQQRLPSKRLFTAARCVVKTSLTHPSFSVTCGLTPERGPSPAPCVKKDFQRRVCSWSTNGSTRGRNHFLALSAKRGLPVRASSGCTGGLTPARGRITAPSAWKAFPDTGTWKRTWRRCTLRWSLVSRGKSSRVRIATRAVTLQRSWETTRGLTLERGRTSAPTATNGLPCQGRWWGTSGSTRASRPTTAPTAGRRLRSSGLWPPTCGLTREKSHTAARSATRPSSLLESCGGTPGFTRGKSRTRAQAVGGTSR